MSVIVRSPLLAPRTGISGITSNLFTDDFNRANTALGAGTNWMHVHGRPVTSGVYSTARILTNQLRCFRTGGAGDTTPGAWFMPIPTISQLFGRRQFVQATYSALTVVTGPANGLAIMVTPDILVNNSTGYLLEWSAAAVMNLRSMASGAFTLLAGPLVVAAGDVIRMTAIPAAANNTIEIFRNGASVTTVVDALATRPIQTGSPGVFLFSQPGDATDLDDFSCGVF